MRTISLLTLFNGVISFNGICWQLEKYRMSPGYFLKFMTIVLVRRINPPPVKIGVMDSLQECGLLLASFCIWCLKGWCQLNIMYTNLSVLPLMFITWCFIWRFIQYFFWEKPQTVMVQFIFEGLCFLCGHVLVNVIDIGYFHSVYFYICCLLGWAQRFVKADLRTATFPLP